LDHPGVDQGSGVLEGMGGRSGLLQNGPDPQDPDGFGFGQPSGGHSYGDSDDKDGRRSGRKRDSVQCVLAHRIGSVHGLNAAPDKQGQAFKPLRFGATPDCRAKWG
jgi:hypothetical protein